MIDFLIVADDFTGALDTGVQFSRNGIPTMVCVHEDMAAALVNPHARVLSVSTESRHLGGGDAYKVVYETVRAALFAGVQNIYKKTDSALRGNIGSELQAVVDAAGIKELPFQPAYPKNKRTTTRGIHYYDGVEVSKSMFARDPFNPVKHSRILDIIREQSGMSVRLNPSGPLSAGQTETAAPAVHVYDAAEEADFLWVIEWMREQGPPYIAAGSAGLAEFLPELMPGQRRNCSDILFPMGKIIVVSGSMSAQAIEQVKALRQNGFPAFPLETERELEAGFPTTTGFKELVGRMCGVLEQSRRLLIYTAGAGVETGAGPVSETRRKTACENTSGIVKALLADQKEYVLVVVGGDTLVSIIKELFGRGLEVLDEIEPGVTVSRIPNSEGGQVHIISKAGSFGDSEILIRIWNYIENHTR